jgi:hypothetical protein
LSRFAGKISELKDSSRCQLAATFLQAALGYAALISLSWYRAKGLEGYYTTGFKPSVLAV